MPSFDYHVEGYETGRPREALDPRQRRAGRRPRHHRQPRQRRGPRRHLCERLKELIPRQLFKIAIQAAIGARVIARETVSALRKDVTANATAATHPQAQTLEKQKEGKKKMRQYGSVEIPQSAFLAALKMGDRLNAYRTVGASGARPTSAARS